MAITTEELFRRFFQPLYLDGPDSARVDVPPHPEALAHLDDAAKVFTHAPDFRDLRLDFSDASVHHLSRALTPERRDAWIAAAPQELFNVVVHGAAYVGACIVRSHGGAWRVKNPLWESLVTLESRAGRAELAVFHWWLKSLGDDSRSTSLADRYRTHVEIPCARPEDLPVIAPDDRALPRLAKASRYDVLYKYLKSHVPELRDLGEHFPTPERYDELGFKWIEAKLLGGGRMLLLHGQRAEGAQLFWLTAAGFEKSAFYPCDAFPEHVVKIAGEKIAVIVSVQGKPVTHEMLWWGP
jgi:hypothetical protein